jgi:hypothetical protein
MNASSAHDKNDTAKAKKISAIKNHQKLLPNQYIAYHTK